MKTTLGTLALVVLSTLIVGCGTLPDAKPFADATHTLSISARSSGQALVDSLRDAGSVTPSDREGYEDIVKRFQAAWSDRTRAMKGVTAYSDALAELIAAGRQGEETVKKVADSLQALASAVSLPLASPAAGVASEIASFLAERLAVVRASRRLEEALAEAQPAIDRIAEQLASESERQLKPTLRRAYLNIVSGIKSQYDDDDSFARSFALRRQELRQKAMADPGLVPRLQEFDRLQSAAVLSLKERDQKIDQATSVYRTRLQLVDALSDATATWASAHRDLAGAVREKRKVDATELQQTVAELKELIRKVRAL